MLLKVLMFGSALIVAVGVPVALWLTKLVWPPKPKEEAIHRGIEEAGKRIDRFPY
jgi:hypothetical protein